jgi:hypothetical protein
VIPETSGHVDNGPPIDVADAPASLSWAHNEQWWAAAELVAVVAASGYEFKRAIAGPVNRPRSDHRPKS